MIRLDLEAANICYQDPQGRVADFHALRHTFITNLARAGVHPRHAQALARHSTLDLTMNTYTHLNLHDLTADIEALPAFTNQAPGNLRDGHADCRPTSSLPDGQVEGPLASPELAKLAENWNTLPDHIRHTIHALANL